VIRRLAVIASLVVALASPSVVAAADAPNTCAGATVDSAQGVWLQDAISSGSDVDWYRFTIGASRTGIVTLGNLAADYRIDLYSACATLLGSSNRSSVQFEEIVRSLAAGSYRVKVSSAAGGSSVANYWLKFRALTAGVTVLSAGPFVVGSNLHIAGEVLNTTSGNRKSITVTAFLYDSSNLKFGAVSGPAFRTIIPPGGRSAFHLITALPADFDHASFAVSALATSTNPIGNLTVTPGTNSITAGVLTYPGTVTNGNGFRIATTKVIVTAYNATGSVLNAGMVTASPSTIDAGATASFSYQTGRYAGTNRWGFMAQAVRQCDPAYPSVCIPSPPPDLDCGDISYRGFTVLPADPHGFDGDNDGIGCES